jgi:hypothetical protein
VWLGAKTPLLADLNKVWLLLTEGTKKLACKKKRKNYFIKNTDKTQRTYMHVAEVTISQHFASRIHVAEVAILQHRIPSASRDGG